MHAALPVLNAPQGRLHAVRNARRQYDGPLVDSLIRDANSFRGGGDGPTEESDCIDLEHQVLNHSSWLPATIVFVAVVSLGAMHRYKDRLKLAMALSGTSETDLAEALKVTRQGITKALKGGPKGTSAMSAYNNSLAARRMQVDPDWLATGKGEPRSDKVWPFETLTPEQWASIPWAARRQAEAGAESALPSPRLAINNPTDDSPVAGRSSDAAVEASRTKGTRRGERDKNR